MNLHILRERDKGIQSLLIKIFLWFLYFSLYVFSGSESFSKPNFRIFLGNNKPISQIGVVYGEKLGINNNNGNNAGGNNSSSDPYIINHDIQFGIQAYKKLNLYGANFNYGVTAALGSTNILFKEGIGIFVEAISVKSLNLEFEPEVTIDYAASENFVLFGGISHSIVWTDDDFELGSWEIKENLHFRETYHNVGVRYKAFKNRVLIEAKLYKNEKSEFFSLRFLFPLSVQ